MRLPGGHLDLNEETRVRLSRPAGTAGRAAHETCQRDDRESCSMHEPCGPPSGARVSKDAVARSVIGRRHKASVAAKALQIVVFELNLAHAFTQLGKDQSGCIKVSMTSTAIRNSKPRSR